LDGDGHQVYSYQLMIIQFTDPTFTLGSVPAGTYSGHFLGLGGNNSPLWVHSLFTVDNLGMGVFDPVEWVSSNPSVTAPTRDYYISIINPSGTVRTSLNDSYHGQISGDGMFIVGTQMHVFLDDDGLSAFYSLGIDIRTNGVITP
jgi:hypothetical protein